ncbi:hypothetical protein NSK_006375 [Nannochloropsis salina CCMP1776]|uniref:Uncharacterized protein n=1 Tax=Nannochloropsis salina CCMP1776 TaxID=1027361 RepID=A0A4D9CXX7_9STRA|nr:hypothetical protein NSK_006375 [Nannochloropsis salina CCMP1776]|eukprot:TFJ82255.1 hypothetical protein NSK_006375 [Nannochloropsis salina CCMP1776]
MWQQDPQKVNVFPPYLLEMHALPILVGGKEHEGPWPWRWWVVFAWGGPRRSGRRFRDRWARTETARVSSPALGGREGGREGGTEGVSSCSSLSLRLRKGTASLREEVWIRTREEEEEGGVGTRVGEEVGGMANPGMVGEAVTREAHGGAQGGTRTRPEKIEVTPFC